MKKILLAIFVLMPLIGFSQNSEALREQAIQFFNEGKLKESLASFEKIQDKETLENTNVNIWKEHILDIQNLKFVPNQNYKNSGIVSVKTGLLEHYGVYNATEKQFVIPPVYDKIYFMNGYSYENGFLVHKANKTGLCNAEGKLIIPLGNHTILFRAYSRLINIKQFDNSELSNEPQYAIYDLNGKLLLENAEIIYDYINPFIIIKNNKNQFELYDIEKNKIVLDNCSEIKGVPFDYSKDFDFVLVRKDNQSFFFNVKTNVLEPNPDFETVIDIESEDLRLATYILNLKNGIKEESEYEKYFFVKKNNKTGIYNLKQRKFLFTAVYDSISPLLNCLNENEWKNLIYNEPVTKALAYNIEGLRNNLAFFVFSKNGKYGVKNIYGDKRLESEYDEVDLSSRILIFRKGKKWGFLGRDNELIKPKFDYVEGDGNNAKVFLDGKQYIYQYNYTKKKYYITKPKKEEEDDPERKAERELDRKRKDPNFIEYSDLDYDGDDDREIKRKMIKKGNLYGIADLKNKVIIPPIYKVIYLDGDKFLIQTNDECGGLLDLDGKELIPFVYRGTNRLRNNLYKVYDGLKTGIYDIVAKKEIIPPLYKDVQAINDELFLVMNDQELYGILNKENKIIYPFVIQPYSLSNWRLSSNDFLVVSRFKDLEFSVASLIRVTNGKATDVFDKEILSNCFLGYSKRILLKENNTIRFYDLSKGEFLDQQFKESIYVKESDCYLLKKDELFEYQICSSKDLIKRTTPVVAQWNGYSLYEENNKMGIINKMGEKSKAAFPKVLFLNYVPQPKTLFKYYLSTKSERNGLIDFEGNVVVEAEKYDDIRPISKSEIGLYYPNNEFTAEEISYIFACTEKSDSEYDIIDYISLSGRKIATQKIEKGYKWYYIRNPKGLLLFKSNDSVQMFDLKAGKTILKTKSVSMDGDYTRNIFTNLYYTDEKSGQKERRVQLINSSGTIIADESYNSDDERIDHRKYDYSSIKTWENPLITKRDNKYGLVTFENKVLYPFVCDTISHIENRVWNYNYFFLEAEKNGKKGILDTKGQVLFDIKYDQFEWVNLFESKGNRDDERLLSARTFNIIVKEKGKYGLLDNQLNPILETDFDHIQIGSKIITSVIIARKKDNSIVFDRTGLYKFKVKCDSLRENYKLDYFEIFKDGKQGILDNKGNLIFDYKYPNVQKIEIDNLFIIQKDNKQYLIDDNGKIISDGFTEIKTLEYDSKENYNSKFYCILTKNQNNKVGMIDQKGNTIIPNEYDAIKEISDLRYIHAIKDDKYGIIDFNNNIVLPFKFTDRIYYNYNNKYFDCDIEDAEFVITPQNIILEERHSR
ncbi:hypothetical protein J2Y38_002172 [Flavobacterium sp. 2755]|uniref:WG repeat-containing protein n=1 Tax=Flavobacterium sp. 2755 TaxID=2817765 RepID=UPI00285A04BB|nr:WG repeat-containing protein [Flavobacterium sp. 2755]MDR6761961.1 hypothetical protein [Flavobacterium sp. 2755]